MHDGMGNSVGTAELSPAPKGREHSTQPEESCLRAMHGIHVHAVAKCEGPAFTSAGGHFNPDMKHHGLENPDGPHAGDMPNFTVAADGTAKATVVAPGVTMGDDPHSIFTDGGTALVIHAMADDMKSDPAGNAGRAHRLRRDHQVGKIAAGFLEFRRPDRDEFAARRSEEIHRILTIVKRTA